MPPLTKKQYADICQREEYNPEGCARLMCAGVFILLLLLLAACSTCLNTTVQREVTFKAQQLDGTEWYTGHLVDCPTGHCIADSSGTIHPVKAATISQATGILDNRGIEIWENDIVQDKYGCGKVIFSDGSFLVQFDPTVIMPLSTKYLTVVGNIFDNQTLLNQP
jgi:hypothetical protein